MINDIATDIWFYENFTSMKDIQKTCNLIVDLSNFIFNTKILSKVVAKLCPSKTTQNEGFQAIHWESISFVS